MRHARSLRYPIEITVPCFTFDHRIASDPLLAMIFSIGLALISTLHLALAAPSGLHVQSESSNSLLDAFKSLEPPQAAHGILNLSSFTVSRSPPLGASSLEPLISILNAPHFGPRNNLDLGNLGCISRQKGCGG